MTNPYAPKAIAAAIVAALAIPILALATFIANEAQTFFDMHLDGAALALYISTFLILVLAAVITLVEHVAKMLIVRALSGLAGKDVAVGPSATSPVAPAGVAPRGGGEN